MDISPSSLPPESLPPEIEAAVEANNGGPVAFVGQHGNYVVMGADVYNAGIKLSEDQLLASSEAVATSLSQAVNGELRDADDVFDDLESRYGA